MSINAKVIDLSHYDDVMAATRNKSDATRP
jgi:hypothetical protein